MILSAILVTHIYKIILHTFVVKAIYTNTNIVQKGRSKPIAMQTRCYIFFYRKQPQPGESILNFDTKQYSLWISQSQIKFEKPFVYNYVECLLLFFFFKIYLSNFSIKYFICFRNRSSHIPNNDFVCSRNLPNNDYSFVDIFTIHLSFVHPSLVIGIDINTRVITILFYVYVFIQNIFSLYLSFKSLFVFFA